MNVGTKSILWGVHQFLWHPWTVGRAWRSLHGRWPSLNQWICIFVHDLGYWGSPNMDGEEGKRHPLKGAEMARKIVYRTERLRANSWLESLMAAEEAYAFSLGHSTHYAVLTRNTVSRLYLADKASILFDPPWFYLLRGWLSGEVAEYVTNEDPSLTARQWLTNYRERIKVKVCLNKSSS